MHLHSIKRNYTVEEQREYFKFIQHKSDLFATEILRDWKQKVLESIKLGYTSTVIFRLKSNKKNGFLLFLLCGPMNEDISWFIDRGIDSVIHQIHKEVYPFVVESKRTHKNINSIYIKWHR